MHFLLKKWIFLCFLLFPLIARAQSFENKSHKQKSKRIDQTPRLYHSTGTFLIGFDVLTGDQTTSPRWRTSYNRKLSATITAGIGAGFTFYNDPLSLLPLFVALKYRLLQSSVFPFISLKAGYNFSILTDTNTLVDSHHGGLLFNPAVGVQFPLKKGTAIYLIGAYNIDKASFHYGRYGHTVTTDITYRRFMAGIGLIF